MGRGGHQHRRLAAQRADQVFVEEPARLDRAPGHQRPQHPEQQPVDVLVRDRALHLGAVELLAEGGLQRIHLPGQLAHAFDDGARRAGAAGGEHHQLQRRFVQRLQHLLRVGRRIGLQRRIPGRHVAGEPGHARAQPFQRGRQVVTAQEHPLAGMPGTQQGGGEGQRVIEIQGPVGAGGTRERLLPAQYLRTELRVLHHGVAGDADDAARARGQRQPVQCDPLSHGHAPP
ncbi:hypothetical protein D3C71_1541800 [compost metagenome]